VTEHSQRTSGAFTSPINTSVPPPGPAERTTPRAQTRQEVEDERRRRSRASTSLEGEYETSLFPAIPLTRCPRYCRNGG